MKKIFILIITIFFVSANFASPWTDRKVGVFFDDLKDGEISEGLEALLLDTSLEEKVLNVTQTKNNWINQFRQISSIYGDFIGHEKVFSKKLGKIEVSYYFVYCETYLIQFIVTEYEVNNKTDIINFVFDDQILNTLDEYGTIRQ